MNVYNGKMSKYNNKIPTFEGNFEPKTVNNTNTFII